MCNINNLLGQFAEVNEAEIFEGYLLEKEYIILDSNKDLFINELLKQFADFAKIDKKLIKKFISK